MKSKTLLAVALVILPVCARAADNLSCDLVQLNDGGHPTGVDVTVEISPGDQNYPQGAFLSGAHCVFNKTTGNPLTDPDRDRQEGYTPKQGGAGYRCFVAPNPTSAYSVTLQAVVCRGPSGDTPTFSLRAPFSNDGLGGNTVVLAINGSDRNKALPVDYRLCNTAGGDDIAIVDTGAAKPLFVPMGTCVETKTPKGIAFRTPDTVVVDESGFYRAFHAGVFARTRKVRLHMTPDEKLDQTLRGRVTVTEPATATAACALPPWQGGPNVDSSWMGYCQLKELAAGKNYRICFDKGFSMQADGRLEYPGSLLPLVLDAARMAQKQPENYVGFDYLAITYGCRDVFNLKDAYILIANNTWNGQKVGSIRYSFSEITIVE